MSWSTERSRSGKRPWQWIEIEVDRCTLDYGESPCAAAIGVTGEAKCLNSWSTCQDPTNFSSAPFYFRFGEATSDIPRVFVFSDDGLPVFLPLLRSVSHSPSLPNPGESMGIRSQLTIELSDAPHHDIGIDKYISERTHDAMRSGSFLRKLKARWPHYIGRKLRWYQGYITDNPSVADFRVREFVMEKFEGPDSQGSVRIIAKDILKLLADERAQAPRKSTGELNDVVAASGAVATVDILTTDDEEYDLYSGEATGYVRIGKEIFSYTGTTPITDGVRLTGVARNNPPSQYVTEEEAHEVGDLVQRCLYLVGRVPQVLHALMTEYGGIDPAIIPESDWYDEAETWAPEDISRLITDPEGVASLINEVISQTLTWGVWYDDIDLEIKYRAIRPADVNDVIEAINDDANIVADSVRIVDKPDAVVNEIQVLYGQINPIGKQDDVENYRSGYVAIDVDSQSINEIGQRRIKRVFARWWPATQKGPVTQYAERTLSSRASNLRTVEFQLERKDEGIRTSQFSNLTTMYIVDEFGIPKQVRVQVLQAAVAGELMTYRAMEDFFRIQTGFARWAPERLDGVDYDGTDATDDDRSRYMAWCQDNGTFTNADEGKRWS